MPGTVNVNIGGYPFVCYLLANASFIDIAAVYVVLCVAQDGSWTVLDVGQSGELGGRIENHPRRDCWLRCCPTGNIWVCVHQTPTNQVTKEQRLALESTLRKRYNPPCGER